MAGIFVNTYRKFRVHGGAGIIAGVDPPTGVDLLTRINGVIAPCRVYLFGNELNRVLETTYSRADGTWEFPGLAISDIDTGNDRYYLIFARDMAGEQNAKALDWIVPEAM